eukprot:scaffold100035_cov54-Attheya_sp.AAC.2
MTTPKKRKRCKQESKNGNHPQSNHKKTEKTSAKLVKVEMKDGGKNDETKQMIRKEDINLLPLISWEGPVRLLNSGLEMKEAMQEIMSSGGETLLGFDTETRPSFIKGESRHPPALVQIHRHIDMHVPIPHQSDKILGSARASLGSGPYDKNGSCHP